MATAEQIQQAADPETSPELLQELSRVEGCGHLVAQNPNTPVECLGEAYFLANYLPLIEQNPVWALFALENPTEWVQVYRQRMSLRWIIEGNERLDRIDQIVICGRFAYRVLPLLAPYPKIYPFAWDAIKLTRKLERGEITLKDFDKEHSRSASWLFDWHPGTESSLADAYRTPDVKRSVNGIRMASRAAGATRLADGSAFATAAVELTSSEGAAFDERAWQASQIREFFNRKP